jgi:hypothetical protein
MNKVGFVDLKAGNTAKVKQDIAKLLKSNWLDHETAQEFYSQMKARHEALGLAALKKEIEAEITFRQKKVW